ncbi:hypothetical protein C8J56DRAFT_451187 [Mycena floridula]|nr:hypothetical protein C8J56DRAFT_451187 [Mycena floridula]
MFCTVKSFWHWHLLCLASLIGAFEIHGPSQTASFATENITFSRHRSDPETWTLSISLADGSNATMLRPMFTPQKNGNVNAKIPLAGTLILTAVNPSNASDIYATSAPFQSVDSTVNNDDSEPTFQTHSAITEHCSDGSGQPSLF